MECRTVRYNKHTWPNNKLDFPSFLRKILNLIRRLHAVPALITLLLEIVFLRKVCFFKFLSNASVALPRPKLGRIFNTHQHLVLC